MYHYYKLATKIMGRPTIKDLMDEIDELKEAISRRDIKNIGEEANDVIHSLARKIRLPNIVVWKIANQTAMKHATRMKKYNCPRSLRNHLRAITVGRCCCETTKK